ncbi:glycosyltransferase family 2 protein [bacterium]|nr:glycosyltransferase family 2 protein [bacterium]
MRELSVVIPNWNGAEQLGQNLLKIYAFLRKSGLKFEIIVVDDASTDDSESVLSDFSFAETICNKKNLGFAKTANKGVASASYKHVFILSNDIVLENSLEHLFEHFDRDDVFAVMPQVKLIDTGFFAYGKRGVKWENGLFKVEEQITGGQPVNTLFASGGSAIFKRDLFLALGGFDSLYEPFYWEEIDLSYRAWKRGYSVIYDPRTFVWNTRCGVIKQFYKQKYIKHISGRNSYLFVWKNITQPELARQHILQLAPSFFEDVVCGKWRFPVCLAAALGRFWDAYSKRCIEYCECRRSDEEVFALVNSSESVISNTKQSAAM